MSAALDISQEHIDAYLEFAVSCELDPVRWIEHAYPWGMKGSILENERPHDWQLDTAQYIGNRLQAMHRGDEPQMSINVATASGHGIGKSVMVAMLNDWNLATLRNARGVTTANTLDQLTSKTWAELAKWHHLSISQPFFTWTATRMFSTEANARKNWAVDASPWSDTNYEAFQGLHNKGRRILIQFDEASALPAKLFELVEGAKTDEGTQIIHMIYGNPTRNSGPFYDCFGINKRYWHTQKIDSRDVPGTNKTEIAQWVEQHGEDSDFVRVRVRGEFPNVSAEQFIPTSWVEKAMEREPFALADDPLILGIDFARGGKCSTVLFWRRGKDAKTIKPDVYDYEPDSMVLVAKIMQRIKTMRPDIVFGDADGVGGPVCDRLLELGAPIIAVMAGGGSEFPDHNLNKKADLWQKGREWLGAGGALHNDEKLKRQISSMETIPNPKGKLQMEHKENYIKRIGASPDEADAFMLTFAYSTTELLSAEHMADRQGERVRDDFDQWEDERVADDGEAFDLSARQQRSRARFLGGGHIPEGRF